MRILALSDHFEDCYEYSSFRVRYLTALKMSKKGHNVAFMFPSRGLRCQKLLISSCLLKIGTPGLLPKRFRTGGFGLLDVLCKSIEVLKSRYDVIHTTHGHRPSQFIPCLLGKYVKGARIVDETWEWLGKGGYADIRKGIIGNCVGLYDRYLEISFKSIFDHVVVISTSLKNRFKNKDKVSVLYGGAENYALEPYKIVWARQSVGLPQKAFCVGMSNVLRSDHDENKIFFEAFSRLCKKHENLYLVATGADVEYIREIGEAYNCAERIIAPGYVEFDLYNKYLSSCDVFVMPYPDTPINRGRWPNKLGDFLCLGRPIITNPTGDVSKLFEKYRIGFLCKAAPDTFYHLLDRMITKEIDVHSHTKDCDYVANSVLSFEKRIGKLLGIFEHVVDAKRTNSK